MARLPKTLAHPLRGARKLLFGRLCAVAVGQAACAAAVTVLVKQVFDNFGSDLGRWPAPVTWGLALLAATAVAAGWLRYRERIYAEQLGQGFAHAVRLRLFEHLSGLAPRELQRRSRGGYLLRFVGDLTALRNWVSLGLARLSVAVVMALGSLGALAFLNWRLALVAAAALLACILVSVGLRQRLRAAVRESRRQRAHLAGDISERINLMAVVQAFAQTDREHKRVARKGRRLRQSMIGRAGVIGQLRGAIEMVAGLALVALLLVGDGEITAGRATAGTLLSAISVLAILITSLRDMSRVFEYWQGYKVAMERIEAFFGMPAMTGGRRSGAKPLDVSLGRVVFQDVEVAGALNGVTAVAEPGQVISVGGANGAGKSTLLGLVARMVEPDGGRILIDDQDIAVCSLDSVRAAVGVVSPDLPLMRGTVRRNICYRWPSAGNDEIEAVCRLCGVDQVLADLPDGLQTRLSEGGGNLSLGQRQRIALARALLGRPRILLIDEPDANLDSASARIIDDVLRSFDGTVLLVSHRPDTVRNADHFWHLADGELKVGARPRDGAVGPVIRRPETVPADPLAGECTATIGGGRVVSGLATGIEPACPYLIYLPPEVDKRLPPLVAVHGITRDPRSYIEAFARRAELVGLPVIAPLFATDGFPAYQRLGISGKGPGPRSDLALDAVLRDVAEKSYCDTSRIFLFGYSGGGQFAHRYAMAHPDRVAAAALGAPGWYTFPDDTNAFPHGTRVGPGKFPQGFRAAAFLRVPVAVYVGDKDCERDGALNTSPRIDHQQGKTRIERGEHWIHAMEHGAKLYRIEVRHHFEILRNCGHSFEECVKNGGVVDKIFAFFMDSIESNKEKTDPSGSNITNFHRRIEEEFAIYSC